jgi:hypothetical protein
MLDSFKESVSQLYIVTSFRSRDLTVYIVLSAFTANLVAYKIKTSIDSTFVHVSLRKRLLIAGCETANRLYCWCCSLVSRMWNSQQTVLLVLFIGSRMWNSQETVLLVLFTGQQDVKQPRDCIGGALYWSAGSETANRLYCWCCLLVSRMW